MPPFLPASMSSGLLPAMVASRTSHAEARSWLERSSHHAWAERAKSRGRGWASDGLAAAVSAAARTGRSEEDAGEDARRTRAGRCARRGDRVSRRRGVCFLGRASLELFVRRLAIHCVFVVAVGCRRRAANLVPLGVGQRAN